MKKTLITLVFFGCISLLSGCTFIEDIIESQNTIETSESKVLTASELQAQMMDTRTLIRAANVGVSVDQYRVVAGRFERMAGTNRGSAVVFHEDEEHYYALTNFHVIDPRDFNRVDVTVVPTYVDVTVLATVLETDEALDLAILRFPKGDLDLPLIPLTEREFQPPISGEMVFAVGNPSAVSSTVSFGEYIRMSRIDEVDFAVLLHSALIFPGNSGGALTDIHGNLLGINTWASATTNERNLAIPLREVLRFLREHGYLA